MNGSEDGCKMDADINAATAFADEYGFMPQLLTEYPPFDCDITAAAAKAGIGSSWCAISFSFLFPSFALRLHVQIEIALLQCFLKFIRWHYADYCDTCDSCIPVEKGKSWGACITGWGWGFANRTDAFSNREDCMECAVPWTNDADCPKPPPPPSPL